MLIIALVLAVIGLALLVFAVVTSNALVAWFCIAASLLGVILLIVDAVQERRRRPPAAMGETAAAEAEPQPDADRAAEGRSSESPYEDYPEESDENGGAQEMASRRAESSAGASEEPGGSDEYDHSSADQGARGGEDTSR